LFVVLISTQWRRSALLREFLKQLVLLVGLFVTLEYLEHHSCCCVTYQELRWNLKKEKETYQRQHVDPSHGLIGTIAGLEI